MLKTNSKSIFTNYPLSVLMGLVFSFSITAIKAQNKGKTAVTPKSDGKSEKEVKKEETSDDASNSELLKKVKEIESLEVSDEEKKKMLAEIGYSYDQSLGRQICFTPKTIATQSLERFPDMFGDKADAYLANVLVLNPAIALDFNMYADASQSERSLEVSKTYTLDEKSIMLWVLPNLQLMRKYNRASNLQLVQSVHLFFQHKPELYNFIPIRMRKLLNSEKGIDEIIQTQQKYLSNI